LYSIPATYHDEYCDIISWQSDYQACDNLQMNCKTGERFGIRELSGHNSSLTGQGIKICKLIMNNTDIPTYYYLYRHHGRSRKSELQRKCPQCNQSWFFEDPVHNLFDFKCDQCHLFSNIAFSIP
jgi:predicted  nucleic acid-binding Zn ribbon protein